MAGVKEMERQRMEDMQVDEGKTLKRIKEKVETQDRDGRERKEE